MTLSVTESELVAVIDCVQDLLFKRRVLESIGLQVELLMVLRVDNRGVVDLVNNWSVTGCMCHSITVRTNFLRELKEQGFIFICRKGSQLSKLGKVNMVKSLILLLEPSNSHHAADHHAD